MEIIRQNSDDRCVAGRRVYTVMPVNSGNEPDYNAYTDPTCQKVISFDDLINAFYKGNLIITERTGRNGINYEWNAIALSIVNDIESGKHIQRAVVTYIGEATLESLVNADTNKAYCQLGKVISDVNPDYVYVEPEP